MLSTLSGLTTLLKNCNEGSYADTFHGSLAAYVSGLTTLLKNCNEGSYADTFHGGLAAYGLAVSLLDNMKRYYSTLSGF